MVTDAVSSRIKLVVEGIQISIPDKSQLSGSRIRQIKDGIRRTEQFGSLFLRLRFDIERDGIMIADLFNPVSIPGFKVSRL